MMFLMVQYRQLYHSPWFYNIFRSQTPEEEQQEEEGEGPVSDQQRERGGLAQEEEIQEISSASAKVAQISG